MKLSKSQVVRSDGKLTGKSLTLIICLEVFYQRLFPELARTNILFTIFIIVIFILLGLIKSQIVLSKKVIVIKN
jgi:hypothetical protein